MSIENDDSGIVFLRERYFFCMVLLQCIHETESETDVGVGGIASFIVGGGSLKEFVVGFNISSYVGTVGWLR